MLEESSAGDPIIFKLALRSLPISIITAAQKMSQQVRVSQHWMTNESVQKPLQCTPPALDKLIRKATYRDIDVSIVKERGNGENEGKEREIN